MSSCSYLRSQWSTIRRTIVMKAKCKATKSDAWWSREKGPSRLIRSFAVILYIACMGGSTVITVVLNRMVMAKKAA